MPEEGQRYLPTEQDDSKFLEMFEVKPMEGIRAEKERSIKEALKKLEAAV